LRAIASSYGVTYEVLTGDLSNVNFSSGRMGWIEMQRQISDWQENVLIPACDKMWKWFCDGANLKGEISENYIPVSWTPPRREMIDPVKEIKGMSEEVRNGFTSWSDAVTSRGWDANELINELAREAKLFDDFKLMLACDRPVPITESTTPKVKEEKKADNPK
jgi:capsid protein